MSDSSEITIKESWEIYDELEDAFVAYHDPKVNTKWVSVESLVEVIKKQRTKNLSVPSGSTVYVGGYHNALLWVLELLK
jgi:hypothetical protein